MKKIALISDGWKRRVTYSWVDGIMQGAKELGAEICLYQFNTNGNWSHDAKQNIGEYNLYNLPNYNEYDGIVFDCTNTVDQQQISYIIDKLKKIDKPVVSIGYYVDGFYYVGNDNKKLFRELIDHLYKKHDCRDFVFAGGPDYNYENKMRYEAFKEAMDDYGITISDDKCLFGSYDFSTGLRYMEEWVKCGKAMPDAFVCANDNIAAGMCSAAEKLGYKIPDDFLLTGFDNLDKASYYNPQITTVEHNRGNIGKFALKILCDLWDGKDVDEFTYLESECIYGESCGCSNSGRVEYRNYIKWQIEDSVKKDEFDEAVMVLENQITECVDYNRLFHEFAEYIESLDCDGVYIVVDRLLNTANRTSQFKNNGYNRENMYVAYAHDMNNTKLEFESIDELDRHMHLNGRNQAYMFASIHFRDQIVGYTILKNPRFLYDNPSFYDVHSVFMVKLENLYKQKQLENANEVLKNIYNRDTLTGLYNRLAYIEMVVPKFESYHARGIKCAMVFFDADHFKELNDTKGHKYGDEVLKNIATVLDEFKPVDGLAYRFGGDEFVVFFPDATAEKTNKFVETVSQKFNELQIAVSHGVIVTNPASDKKIDEYLVMADQEMYKVKSARRQQNAFYKGMDISSLPEHIDGGGKFYDENGKEIDAFDLLEKNNINSLRLRIWNNPSLVPESKGYCDLAKTMEMAKRIKEKKMHFVLDFHYSDFWADPGQQRKPKEWEDLSFTDLKAAVYDYTRHVLIELDKIGCLPDMVQVGNEIRSGMLFPDGEVPNYAQLAQLVNAGIKACRDVSDRIEVMIHLDQGGRFYYLKEWFDSMFAAGMDKIDAIGISFYSFWHGTFMDLRDSMSQLIDAYKLPVYVMETAHPWRQCEGEHVSAALMKTAGLPAGIDEQKRSLEIIMQIAAEISGNMKTGVYYWEPLCLPGYDYGSWDENMGMLDENGKVLESFEAYRIFSRNELPITNLNDYIESLYEIDEDDLLPAGTNLVENGSFENGSAGWWVTKNSNEVICNIADGEAIIESKSNFKLNIFCDVHVDSPGKYTLSVEYRGTNTTGVKIGLFLRAISCNGEKLYREDIFPSDVRYVVHSLEEVELPAGPVQIGITMDTPPITGKIKNFRLIKVY